jgi:cardiolipin synthase
MAFSIDRRFIESVETMLQEDLNASVAINLNKDWKKPFWFKLAARVSRLLEPIL